MRSIQQLNKFDISFHDISDGNVYIRTGTLAEISKLCTYNFNNFDTVKYMSKNIMEE